MDSALFGWLNALAGRSAILDLLGSDWAKYGPVVLVLFAANAWLLFPGDPERAMPRRAAVLALAAALVGLGVSQLIGHVWFRDRPYVAHVAHLLVGPSADPSFPSDHAVGAFALATPFVLDQRTRLWGSVIMVGAVALGIARVFVGTHYPSDVLGGALLGIGVGWGLTAGASWVDRTFPVLCAPLRLASGLTDRVVHRRQ